MNTMYGSRGTQSQNSVDNSTRNGIFLLIAAVVLGTTWMSSGFGNFGFTSPYQTELSEGNPYWVTEDGPISLPENIDKELWEEFVKKFRPEDVGSLEDVSWELEIFYNAYTIALKYKKSGAGYQDLTPGELAELCGVAKNLSGELAKYAQGACEHLEPKRREYFNETLVRLTTLSQDEVILSDQELISLLMYQDHVPEKIKVMYFGDMDIRSFSKMLKVSIQDVDLNVKSYNILRKNGVVNMYDYFTVRNRLRSGDKVKGLGKRFLKDADTDFLWKVTEQLERHR